MKNNYLWLIVLSLLSYVLKAQTIELVKDINTEGEYSGLQTKEAVTAGGLYFVLAYDDINTVNLWRSDGTAAGTYILTDLAYKFDTPAQNLKAAGQLVFFVSIYENQYWLYRSDGTKAGTFPLHPVSGSEYVKLDIFEFNDAIYFSADNGTDETLWKTDGTVAGTVEVKSFPSVNSGATGPYDFFNFNGLMYFLIQSQSGSDYTYQLWKSDGTTAGTIPGPAFSGNLKPVVLNGYMYYSDGKALKRTNGNTVTTIKEGFVTIGDPVLIGPTLYFSAGQQYTDIELWKSNGTTAGTVRVKDINTGTDKGSDPKLLTNVNGTLFFAATTSVYEFDLWKSNGTDAGTVLVKDINPDEEGDLESIFALGNQTIFLTGDSPSQMLWKSGGTSAATQKVVEFPVSNAVNISGTIFFIGTNTRGPQIYKSNLTARGTVRVTNLFPPGSYPDDFTEFKGVRYITADDGINGRELWKTDGTPTGTVLVKDITPGLASSNPTSLTEVNGSLFFVANGKEIWKSNGIAAGTELVKNVVSAASDRIEGLINVNGVLYFGVISSGNILRLWKSNGTTAGTVPVVSFLSTPNFKPSVSNGQLVFPARDGTDSYELWKTNGTAAGTTIIKNLGDEEAGNSLVLNGATVLNGFFYYSIENINGIHLVRTDGTAAGTMIIKTIYGAGDANVNSFTVAGGHLYFSSYEYSANSKEALWRTDGTSAGTIRLASFDGHPDIDNYIYGGAYAAGLFYFVPYDFGDGDQLWASDGTPAGTRQVKEIGTVAASDKPGIEDLTAIGDVLYFTASDQVHGTELWQTDGTNEGTLMVQDFNSGGNSEFRRLANYNGTLLLSANNGSAGMELYKYIPPKEMRINTGGAAFAASGSRNFLTDQFFSGATQISSAARGDISGTTDDELYREQRFGSSFRYNIPVANGKVDVILHFAEIYWGVPGKGGSAGAGKRRFHVDIEGVRKLTNYDIFTAAGGAMRARTETFTVDVTGGILNISFSTGAADKPVIAAIEVVLPKVILGPIADATVRNTPYNTTNFGTAATLEIKTGSQASYERNVYLKFSLADIIQVGSAKLRLYGSNIQSSSNVSLAAYALVRNGWTETGITWTNAPVNSELLGTVNVNNTAKYYEIDVTEFVKLQLAGEKIVSFFITNPASQNLQLTFNSRENATNPPQLFIDPATPPAARIGSEVDIAEEKPIAETEQKESGIYPNPAGQHFTVNVSAKHTGKVDLQLISLSGNTIRLNLPQAVVPASNVQVDVSHMQLPSGIYVIKIQSAALTEKIGVLITK